MMRVMLLLALVASGIGLVAVPADAQQRRMVQNETLQRQAVAAWTRCIADENTEEVSALLLMDFTSEEYSEQIDDLSERRISSSCFNALPRRYRRIELGGLPFAGGLAERLITTQGNEPLLNRLAMASIGKEAQVFTYTDAVSNCVVRGAPHLAAGLFESSIASDEETALLEQIRSVFDVCTRGATPIEAGPLGVRSLLATASFRILAAQQSPSEESEDDA